jgi:DNA mismatch repair protein MutS
MRKATTFVNQPSLFDWADSTIEVKVEPSTATKRVTDTPLIAQYHEMKRKHPDAILLFRVGDFYETFAEDAQLASEILKITLTRRCGSTKANPVYLAGFPQHALDTYLPKLVRAGKRVAICEQLEDPKVSKNLVKRGVATA